MADPLMQNENHTGRREARKFASCPAQPSPGNSVFFPQFCQVATSSLFIAGFFIHSINRYQCNIHFITNRCRFLTVGEIAPFSSVSMTTINGVNVVSLFIHRIRARLYFAKGQNQQVAHLFAFRQTDSRRLARKPYHDDNPSAWCSYG